MGNRCHNYMGHDYAGHNYIGTASWEIGATSARTMRTVTRACTSQQSQVRFESYGRYSYGPYGQVCLGLFPCNLLDIRLPCQRRLVAFFPAGATASRCHSQPVPQPAGATSSRCHSQPVPVPQPVPWALIVRALSKLWVQHQVLGVKLSI